MTSGPPIRGSHRRTSPSISRPSRPSPRWPRPRAAGRGSSHWPGCWHSRWMSCRSPGPSASSTFRKTSHQPRSPSVLMKSPTWARFSHPAASSGSDTQPPTRVLSLPRLWIQARCHSSAWQRTRHVVTCFAATARGRRLNAPNHWRCQPGHSWLVIDFSHFTEHGTANTREMRSDTNL